MEVFFIIILESLGFTLIRKKLEIVEKTYIDQLFLHVAIEYFGLYDSSVLSRKMFDELLSIKNPYYHPFSSFISV